MDRSKRDLEALVDTQKEQLGRYEKRLKDVVTAYKGLLKEKEALETSLNAISSKSESETLLKPNIEVLDEKYAKNSSDIDLPDAAANEDKSNLQTQIITLMNSLATLSAEKSRMEASFQADKKQLRVQLGQKDQFIAELQTKIKNNDERSKADVDEVRAKWIIERQEREKETNNQMLMIRELQKLYADERHLKENIEMQLNNFKTQFASNEAENSRLRDLQLQLKETKLELKQLRSINKQSSSENVSDSAGLLQQLKMEMQQLKEQHAVAIKSEQKRVKLAEEESKKQAALHEDRVANLESRLAELSSTVGTYDRLRQQDQESIQALKKKLIDLERSADTVNFTDLSIDPMQRRRSIANHDISAIVDEIVNLKKLLLTENARSVHPIDVSKVLSIGSDHVQCQEEINSLQQQCEAGKVEIAQMHEKMHVQRSHISTLQDKVKVLNRNIDEQEVEIRNFQEKLRHAVREERTKWKDAFAEMENDGRNKVNDLEQQLQKQRQRSLQLLDEKEAEIKTLQTSFEVFHNATMPLAVESLNPNSSNDINSVSSEGESVEVAAVAAPYKKVPLKSKRLSVGDNCHMLHYANEIARKDIEIQGLRKAKYAAETAMRKAIQDKVTAQTDLSDKIALLEEQVDRLERCKTREGANLEYLKNVIISFIASKDADGKRHMMNAISAVLQFTPTEIQTINAAFHKK